MSKEKIYAGYDVVDNDYFYDRVRIVRSNLDGYRSLPGLDSGRAIFFGFRQANSSEKYRWFIKSLPTIPVDVHKYW